ncbi:MAG: hypothetical protein ABI639_04820 [Thermoanaerobaculia bacterium]
MLNRQFSFARIARYAFAVSLPTLAALSPARGSTIYSADFFAAAANNTCTAEVLTNPNTWIRQYRYGGFCPDYPGFAIAKGQGSHPFGSEVFISDPVSGYIEITSEVASQVSNGKVTSYRVFRDQATGQKGMPWLPANFNSSTGKSWVSDVSVEQWKNAVGVASCDATVNALSVPFHSTLDLVQYIGVWPAWIQDKRAGSPNPNAFRDVQVIKKTGIYGSNPEYTEIYYYGRFLNPTTLAWEGVGLIQFEYFQNGNLISSSINNKIVSCNQPILCGACPP